MDLEEIVAGWTEQDGFEGELVHIERLPARGAIHSDLAVDPRLADLLAEKAISRLYRHQARAVESIRSGMHTVVVAGTASGKTLCYQLPIAEQILDQPRSTALLLYPTKALAQDQLRALGELGIPGLVAATYDGDTEREDRLWVRRNANVVLTNPDMLHVGILPNHGQWADFLLRLRYVVVDEMHMFRGIFGSHVGLILRRLRRMATHYGADPIFVFTSATIGNPGELAAALAGVEVTVCDGDDSARGERMVALWNPPLDPDDSSVRRSALTETTDLFVDLVEHDQHSIVFSRSRKATELIYRWARDRLSPEKKDRIAPYRSGYRAADRRETERRLFSGSLLGITATNALELGIDVGALDAAVINTFPGTISSFRQQAGRAGRTMRRSLAVLVGGQDNLDQYFMGHPHELFERSPEAAVINPNNPKVLEAHVACAAHELPLDLADRGYFGNNTEEAVATLAAEGHLVARRGRMVWNRTVSPAGRVGIRTAGSNTYTILDVTEAEVIGTFEASRVYREAHPGAVYLHQGETYVVDQLNGDQREVRVRPAPVDYYTQAQQDTWLDVVDTRSETSVGPTNVFLGSVRVEQKVVGYQRKLIGSGETVATEYLDLPPTMYTTEAVWYSIPNSIIDRLELPVDHLLGALHAAEHAAIGMLPLFAICDRYDIGGLSTNYHPVTDTATIFIYEAYPGGAGISPMAFEVVAEHLRATRDSIQSCVCGDGCPSCIVSPKCGNYNEPLSKAGAVSLLDALL